LILHIYGANDLMRCGRWAFPSQTNNFDRFVSLLWFLKMWLWHTYTWTCHFTTFKLSWNYICFFLFCYMSCVNSIFDWLSWSCWLLVALTVVLWYLFLDASYLRMKSRLQFNSLLMPPIIGRAYPFLHRKGWVCFWLLAEHVPSTV